jgi:hypothetical protein
MTIDNTNEYVPVGKDRKAKATTPNSSRRVSSGKKPSAFGRNSPFSPTETDRSSVSVPSPGSDKNEYHPPGRSARTNSGPTPTLSENKPPAFAAKHANRVTASPFSPALAQNVTQRNSRAAASVSPNAGHAHGTGGIRHVADSDHTSSASITSSFSFSLSVDSADGEAKAAFHANVKTLLGMIKGMRSEIKNCVDCDDEERELYRPGITAEVRAYCTLIADLKLDYFSKPKFIDILNRVDEKYQALRPLLREFLGIHDDEDGNLKKVPVVPAAAPAMIDVPHDDPAADYPTGEHLTPFDVSRGKHVVLKPNSSEPGSGEYRFGVITDARPTQLPHLGYNPDAFDVTVHVVDSKTEFKTVPITQV